MDRRGFLKLLGLSGLGVGAATYLPKRTATFQVPVTRGSETAIFTDLPPYSTDSNEWYISNDVKVQATHRTYAMGFRVTSEMYEDDVGIMDRMANELERSMVDRYRRDLRQKLHNTFKVG